MDDAIFGASASIPAVKNDGDILRDVSNKPLNVTMSGEGASPKKLFVSGRNIVKMPTSGSGTVGGLTYEFTPNGLNVHGTATESLGAVIELAPLLTDNGIRLPDGFYLVINKKVPSNCGIVVFDEEQVAYHIGPTQGAKLGATGGLTHVAFWVAKKPVLWILRTFRFPSFTAEPVHTNTLTAPATFMIPVLTKHSQAMIQPP